LHLLVPGQSLGATKYVSPPEQAVVQTNLARFSNDATWPQRPPKTQRKHSNFHLASWPFCA